MADLQAQFEAAAEEASKKLLNLTNDEKLELYGLYKQAKEGDCNTSKPGIFDPKGRAKWDAWEAKKGLSKEDAVQKYIEFVAAMKTKYNVS